MEQKPNYRGALALFFLLIALTALAGGLSDSIYSNYFKEVYQVDSVQRGFIEFPRELPGVLCIVVIALLSGLGDLRAAVIAQGLAFAGLTVLGLWTPAFGVMLVFLFVNSMGMHLFMPLQDSIGMSLAEPGQVGRRMGQYASTKSAVAFAAALLVFFGFRTGFFSFQGNVKPVFLLGAGAYALAFLAAILLVRKVRPPRAERKKVKLVFRKQYKYYYLLTILNGVQKQIAYVYGSWVVIDLLGRKADTTALLYIASNFVCIFFMRALGKWMDRFGIKKMMLLDALSFIVVYVIYGFLVWGIDGGALQAAGWAWGIYALFVLDRMSMQIGIVKAYYLRSIALDPAEVTATLSTGLSLDHAVAVVAAMLGGFVWAAWGSQWVFFMAATFSLGNLYIAWKVDPEKEQAAALEYRRAHGTD